MTPARAGCSTLHLIRPFDLATNRRIYLAYSEPGPVGSGTNGTAVASADLNASLTALENVKVIFQQLPKKASAGHYGARLIFRTGRNALRHVG